ncbi:MAG: methyltransferase family protein [Promethearchaeia archaeon]
MIIFSILLSVLLLCLLIIFLYRRSYIEHRKYYLFCLCGLILTYIFLAFYDPLQLDGYLAALILGKSPSIFGSFAGIIAGNCAIYAIHVFASSALKKRRKGDLFKLQFINTGQYAKRRHPLYISSYFLALCYAQIMGSCTLFILAFVLLFLLYLNAKYIEKKILLKKFGKDYVIYQRRVPTLLMTKDFGVLTIIISVIFLIGLIGVIFFPML